MNNVEANRSMLNPTDAAMMAQRGDLQQGTTVRQFFEKFGVDVDGPVTQLAQFMKKQAENANPMKKMQNIAGQTPQRPPMAPMGQSQGLDDFTSKLGG